MNVGKTINVLGKFGININLMGKSLKKTSHSFWKNRTVLVTGGGGFLGGWLSRELVRLGAKTIVLDLKISSPVLISLIKEKNKNLKIIQGNVYNRTLVKKILEEYKIDNIFHLAAQAIVGEAIKKPREALKTNIEGTWNLLDLARSFKNPPWIVTASSDKAYGSHEIIPYTEEAALHGTAPYDVSKSCADLICQMYYKTYSFPVCVTRCGNIFGGGDLNFSRLIPDAIRSAFYNQTFVIRSDGSYRRDYIYIKDIVNAYLSLAQKMERKEIWGEAFNFGNNNPYSVLDAVKMIFRLMGKKGLNIKVLGRAKDEIKEQSLLSEKAKKMLDWKPEYNFEKGLKETIRWYQSYFSNL